MKRIATWGGAALLIAISAWGCGARTMLSSSVADSITGSGVTARLDFEDQLAITQVVSNHDAVQELIFWYGLEKQVGEPGDYSAKVAVAKERGWIDKGAEPAANETAAVGWIARAVCLEKGIEGGLSMHLFGASPRYALRELATMEVMTPMSEGQAISGLQLIAILSKTDRAMEKGEGGR